MKKNRKKKSPTFALDLTEAERKIILEKVADLPTSLEEIIRNTPAGQPVQMTEQQLDDLGEYIAVQAAETESKKLEQSLGEINDKISDLLGDSVEEGPSAPAVASAVAQITDWIVQLFVLADKLRLTKTPVPHFWLSPAQRDVLISVSGMARGVKKKLLAGESSFTISEVGSMTLTLAGALPGSEPKRQFALLLVCRHLMERLRDVMPDEEPKRTGPAKAPTDALYQFKITLIDSKPPIWRRIQVQDCTLDKFHEHIQTAMGWTNSHLHQFEIGGQPYGNPELLEDVGDYQDSTTTLLSEILPSGRKKLRFRYEYDFGDGWLHEVLFEGCPPVDPKAKYPLCLEGERACPPEDCGGIWGYYGMLAALADPKHEQHADFMEWIGPVDPEKFDAKKATRDMKKGLPDWREG